MVQLILYLLTLLYIYVYSHFGGVSEDKIRSVHKIWCSLVYVSIFYLCLFIMWVHVFKGLTSDDADSTSPRTAELSASSNTSFNANPNIRLTDFGFCYEPSPKQFPKLSKLPPTNKITTWRECDRAEILTAAKDNNILVRENLYS